MVTGMWGLELISLVYKMTENDEWTVQILHQIATYSVYIRRWRKPANIYIWQAGTNAFLVFFASAIRQFSKKYLYFGIKTFTSESVHIYWDPF